MITHTLQQKTPEWNAFRAAHFNASDAPAMLGISPYKTRNDLLMEYRTGITPEIDPEQQKRFDEGHRFEALARPLAEELVGQELYPCVGSEGKLAASFDGLTMMEDICFEHKSLNNDIRGCKSDEDLPLHYRVQMEQQLIVSGAEKCLFMATKWDKNDQLIEALTLWYSSDPALRQRIFDGWAQFEKDLAEFELPEAQSTVVADPVQDLPAVSVQVSGQIDVRENFKVFEKALRNFLDNKLIREPQTDQDFADLDLQIKAMKKAEETLNAAESMMLAQIQSVDEAKRQKDMLAKLVRDNRLMAEKLLESEKTRRRAEKVEAARKAFTVHVADLQREIMIVRLDVPIPDFASTIKGLKTLASIQDKIDTALANGKITADQQATDIRTKLGWINENASEHRALLADLQQLVTKPFDDFKLAITARIEAHKKAEAVRLEIERERIRAEEETKAKAEAEAKLRAEQQAAERIAREEALRAQEAEARSHAQPAPAEPMVQKVAPVQVINQPSTRTPTLNLGLINKALGFTVSADFLRSLGFTPISKGSERLYHEEDFPLICQAIVQHVNSVVDSCCAQEAAK